MFPEVGLLLARVQDGRKDRVSVYFFVTVVIIQSFPLPSLFMTHSHIWS